MTDSNHRLAQAYFDAVTAGELPDSLLTPDMTAWGTTLGPVSKADYQGMIRVLARMCATPIQFTVNAITAEEDRMLAEATSTATLINGEPYSNTYVFSFRIRDGRIAWIAEHYNALLTQQKLLPLMAQLSHESK